MYFFIEQSLKAKTRAEQFEIDFQDIYVNSIEEMQAEYSLPSLHEWGDGYVQGDASNDEIFELFHNINKIEDGEEPTVFCEEDDENEGNLLTDIYEYLDKKLIAKIEDAIESQIITFGDDEYSSTQFDNFKEKAEEVIKELLKAEYYQSGGTIGHDYTVFLLADEMKAFEHVEVSSNWMFQEGNEARFCILHLNNYDKAFNDYSDLIGEESYSTTRDNLGISDEVVKAYLLENDIEIENDEIKDSYKEMSYDARIDMWKEIASNGIESYDEWARGEAIDKIIEGIEWDEIESWFDAQFNQNNLTN